MPLTVGAHVSRTNGYLAAADQTVAMGGTCFQVFTGSPQRLLLAMDSLAAKPAAAQAKTRAELAAVKARTSLSSSDPNRVTPFVHSPYRINLCDVAKRKLNTKVLVQELEMCDLLGGVGVVVHTGTQQQKQCGQTRHGAYEAYVATVKAVLAAFTGTSRLLIETSAGQGYSIGVTMRDFGRLYNAFAPSEQARMGIVVDTCHVFVAGYDLSTAAGVDAFVAKLCTYVRKSDVRLIHLNDSAKPRGSQVDRHAPLGKGHVYADSYAGLAALFGYFPDVPYVLETHDKPPYAQYASEIARVHKLKPRTPKPLAGRKADTTSAVLGRMRAAMEAMASLYYAQQDGVRGDAYSEARYRVEMLTTVPTTKRAWMALPGIGDKLSDKLLELYYTDRLTKLEALREDPVVAATIDLVRVPGVGAKTVAKYLALGIRTLDDLRAAVVVGSVALTAAQKLGLAYVDDLRQRVPRAEAERLEKCLAPLMDTSGAKVELVGSYRRGKPTLGDVDVLATGVTMDALLSRITDAFEVKGFVSKGQHKAALLVVLDKAVRHVDVLVTPPSAYPFALVHFTGSKFFNIQLRTVAQQGGYSLSEHGLSPRTKGATVPTVRDEKGVFAVLGVPWVAPEER